MPASIYNSVKTEELKTEINKPWSTISTTQIKILVEDGADPETESMSGNTAIILTASKGDVEVTSFLLSANANTNKQNEFGFNALMLAAQGNHTTTVDVLKDKTDLTLKSKGGATAHDIAHEHAFKSIEDSLFNLKTAQDHAAKMQAESLLVEAAKAKAIAEVPVTNNNATKATPVTAPLPVATDTATTTPAQTNPVITAVIPPTAADDVGASTLVSSTSATIDSTHT